MLSASSSSLSTSIDSIRSSRSIFYSETDRLIAEAVIQRTIVLFPLSYFTIFPTPDLHYSRIRGQYKSHPCISWYQLHNNYPSHTPVLLFKPHCPSLAPTRPTCFLAFPPTFLDLETTPESAHVAARIPDHLRRQHSTTSDASRFTQSRGNLATTNSTMKAARNLHLHMPTPQMDSGPCTPTFEFVSMGVARR